MHISQYTFIIIFNKYKNNNTVIPKENEKKKNMSIKETLKTALTLEISILIWYVLSLTSCFLSWMVQHVILGIKIK